MAEIFGLTESDRATLREIVAERRSRRVNPSGRPHLDDSPAGTADVYIARAPDTGVPGLSPEVGSGTGSGTGFGESGVNDVPGSAECPIYSIRMSDGEEKLQRVFVADRLVYNLCADEVEAGAWMVVVKDKFGRWLIVKVCATSASGTTTTTTGAACTGNCLWSYDAATATFDLVSNNCSPRGEYGAGTGSGTGTGTGTGTADESGYCYCVAPTICPTDPGSCFETRTACSKAPTGKLTVCSSTTSTTSTTGGPGTPCGDGCGGVFVPGVGFVQTYNNCDATCPCVISSAGPCVESVGACVPCYGACLGSCRYIWGGVLYPRWHYVGSGCYWSGCNGRACICDPPPEDGDECGQEYTTGCYTPGDPPTPTTTTVPTGCTGTCYLRWDVATGAWVKISSTCGSHCLCRAPLFDGVSDCEYTRTNCYPPPTTTTTSTTTTTTTTTPTWCVSSRMDGCYFFCISAPTAGDALAIYLDSLPSCTDASASGPYTVSSCSTYCIDTTTTTTTTSSTTTTTTTTAERFNCLNIDGCFSDGGTGTGTFESLAACQAGCFEYWVCLSHGGGSNFNCDPRYTTNPDHGEPTTEAGCIAASPSCSSTTTTTTEEGSTTTSATSTTTTTTVNEGWGCVEPGVCNTNGGPYPTFAECMSACV